MNAEATDPYRLSDSDAAGLLAGAPWSRLVAIGDSVAEGVREPAPGYLDLSWVDRIARALHDVNPGLVHLNLGVRGLLAAQVRERQLAAALEFGPDLAIVTCGGNDVRRPAYDAEGVERELDAMVGALRAAGSDVLTLGLMDITRSGVIPAKYALALSSGIRRLAEITEDVAVRHGALHLRFTDHPAAGEPDILSSDLLHLNARGHAIVAAETIRGLGAHLARSQPA
jgi:lysophospholipase L1-like esterase